MKRKIFLLALFLFVGLGSMQPVMATPSCNRQVKEKSEVELYMQKLAKTRAAGGIDYAYISVTMFKQMFSEMLAGDALKVFGSLRYMRQFMSTNEAGYNRLKNAMLPFLGGDEEVMGMKLMVLNSEDNEQSIVYSSSDAILVLSDDGGEELRVAFIVGMGYSEFMENGMDGFDFGF